MPISTIYFPGQAIYITSTWTIDGVPTDPSTTLFEIKDPTGADTIYTYPTANLERLGTGVYQLFIILAMAGNYYYRAQGIGLADGVDENVIVVTPSYFP
jgi:hypothetical protein